jgi:hypothetical protein
MGIQQTTKSDRHDTDDIGANRAKSCMAIIWVRDGSDELDKMRLIRSLKKMTGVFDARFTREKPAILMIEYCTKETRAVNLAEKINAMGVVAKIVGC